MRKKRILCCVMCLLLCAAVLPVGAAAEEQMELRVEDTRANAGDTVTVSVLISANPGIAGTMVLLHYDRSVFSVVTEEDGTYAISAKAFSPGAMTLANDGDAGLQILWYHTKNVKTNGTLFTVLLKVSDAARSGDYPVTVSGAPENTVTEAGERVPFRCTGGVVRVTGQESGAAARAGEPAASGESRPETQAPAFSDVAQTHWAAGYIRALAERGIVSGNAGCFFPDRCVTRAEFVKMLFGVMDAALPTSGGNAFTDVSGWAVPYVTWAAENGIVNGTEGDRFSPDERITREQIAAILLRCADRFSVKLPHGDEKHFTDEGNISGYARTAVSELAGAGVINGSTDGSFRPRATATRAEAAKMLCIILQIREAVL